MLLAAFLSTVLTVFLPKPVEEASADDCAIVVAIGRAQMDWGPTGPNLPFVAEAADVGGVIYRQRCPWRALGVGAPVLAGPAHWGARFSIGRPAYGEDRRTATTDLVILGPPRRPGGPPFTRIEHCRLEKADGRWQLSACTEGPIT
jgi:hypothetical protein